MSSEGNSRVASVEDTISLSGSSMVIPINKELNLNTESGLKSLIWTMAAGYTMKETETSSCSRHKAKLGRMLNCGLPSSEYAEIFATAKANGLCPIILMWAPDRQTGHGRQWLDWSIPMSGAS